MADVIRTADEHDDCEKCGKPVYGWVEERCCSGRDCGCMGLPTTPCWCTECWAKWDAERGIRRVSPQTEQMIEDMEHEEP